jgi:hypothetical protein
VLKGVGLIWVSFATFILNCCRLIDSLTSYIEKTQTITTWFSSTINMHAGLGFLNLVFPCKWSDNEVKGMF